MDFVVSLWLQVLDLILSHPLLRGLTVMAYSSSGNTPDSRDNSVFFVSADRFRPEVP